MALSSVTVDDIATYGGHDTLAFEGSTLSDVLTCFGLPTDEAVLVQRPGMEDKLRSYETEWGVRIPKSVAELARFEQLGDAAAATGIVMLTPGVYGLEWKCVAPWGEADSRRAIAGAVQEGQGVFYLYFPVERVAAAAVAPAAGGAAAGGAGAGAAAEAAGAAPAVAAASAPTAPAAVSSAPADCPVLVGDFEWSELEAIEAVPAAALRRVANSLYAFLRQAQAATGAVAGGAAGVGDA